MIGQGLKPFIQAIIEPVLIYLINITIIRFGIIRKISSARVKNITGKIRKFF